MATGERSVYRRGRGARSCPRAVRAPIAPSAAGVILAQGQLEAGQDGVFLRSEPHAVMGRVAMVAHRGVS
jgi:hypothetical protein